MGLAPSSVPRTQEKPRSRGACPNFSTPSLGGTQTAGWARQSYREHGPSIGGQGLIICPRMTNPLVGNRTAACL